MPSRPAWPRAFFPFALVLLVFVCGCSPATLIEKLADDKKEQVALAYIKRLADGDIAALSSELAPKLRTRTGNSNWSE